MPDFDSMPPRNDGCGPGQPPTSFTGAHRDEPSPQECVPSLLRDLLHAPQPTLGNSPDSGESASSLEGIPFLQVPGQEDPLVPGLGTFSFMEGEENENENESLYSDIFDMLPTADSREEPPAVGPETASSLKELMGSLVPDCTPEAFRKGAEASPQPTAMPPQLSLADLAGQLVSRFAEKSTKPGQDSPPPRSTGGTEFQDPDDSTGNLGVDWGHRNETGSATTVNHPALFDDFSDLLGSGNAEANKSAIGSAENTVPPSPPARRPLPLPAKPGSASRHGDVFLSLPKQEFSKVPDKTDKIAPPLPPTNDEAAYGPEFLEPGAMLEGIGFSQAVADGQHGKKTGSPISPESALGVFPPIETDPLSASAAETGSGLGLILAGAALVILGLLMACTLPLSWLTLERLDAWSRQTTQAGLLLRAVAGAGLLIIGAGSIFQRRWAPPLAHALGWIGALISSFAIALAAWLWVGSSNMETGMAFPFHDFVFLFAGLLLPLGLILHYQRPSLQDQCDAADPSPKWTDGLAIPGVMVFLAGIALSAGSAAMLPHLPAFPIPGSPPLTGTLAQAVWAGFAGLGAAVAVASVLRKRSAWWLLLVMTLILTAGPAATAITGDNSWTDFLEALGRPSAAPALPEFITGLIALLPVPLVLILAMSRRAFSSPATPPDVR